MTEMVPLGRPFGLLSTSEDITDPESLPFGLRLAVEVPATSIGELAAFGYDTDQQIGTVRDGDQVVPLLRHTTGQTRTTTNPDRHRGPDSDTDHRED
jgi:putative ATP-grasp target RiPP